MTRACIAALAATLLGLLPIGAAAQENPFVDTKPQRTWHLRGTFQDGSIFEPIDKSAARLARDPFLLGFSRDIERDSDSYTLRGSLFYEWRRNIVGRPVKIAAYSLGIDVDQKHAGGMTVRDTLAVKFGGAWFFSNSNPNLFFKSHYLEADLAWITDRDFDLSVAQAQVAWRPLGAGSGFAGAPDCRQRDLCLKFTPKFGATWRRIADDGGRAEYAGPSTQAWASASLRADLTFKRPAVESLSVFAGYEYHAALSSGVEDAEFFQTGLRWRLTDTNHTSLNLTYVKGRQPNTALQEGVTLTIGFAF